MGKDPAPNLPRPLHLSWDGIEWTDDRCGCRYHPDDPNGTHGGAPHVHPCERHKGADGADAHPPRPPTETVVAAARVIIQTRDEYRPLVEAAAQAAGSHKLRHPPGQSCPCSLCQALAALGEG